MESKQAEEISNTLNSTLCQLKWRLKPSSKRRLQIDVLALCSRMRPLVMVDYGGKMPELQDRLCSLFELLQKESAVFQKLRVMVIEDMIYLVNIKEFAEYLAWSLSPGAKQFFVDLEHDPPKMILADDQTSAVEVLVSVYHLFSSVFTPDGVNDTAVQGQNKDDCKHAESSSQDQNSKSYEVLDLSSCLQDYQITIPTLNGWLLGYPVIYLFGKDHISDAIYNLSTKPLHLYRVLFRRNPSKTSSAPYDELMSFSVPYDLSMNGRNEAWAKNSGIKCKRNTSDANKYGSPCKWRLANVIPNPLLCNLHSFGCL